MADENLALSGDLTDEQQQLIFAEGQEGGALTYIYEGGTEADYLAHAGDQYLVGVGPGGVEEEPMDTGETSGGKVLGTVTEVKKTVVTVGGGEQVVSGGISLGSNVQTVDQGDGTVTVVVTPGHGLGTGRITTVSHTTPVVASQGPVSAQKIVILPPGASLASGVTASSGSAVRIVSSADQLIKNPATAAAAAKTTATSAAAVLSPAKKIGRPLKDPAAVKTPKLATIAKKPESTPTTTAGGKIKQKKQIKSEDEELDDDDDGLKVGGGGKKGGGESSKRKSGRKSTMSSKLAEWGLLPSSSGSVLSTSDSEHDSDDVPVIKSVVRTYTKKSVGVGSPGKPVGVTPGGVKAARTSVGSGVGRGGVGGVRKEMQNKSLMCKPIMMTKATSCNPIRNSKSTQTDEDFSTKGKVFVPVPVPLVVPAPVNLYNTPAPVPVPLPVPLPIPTFIPTSKTSLAAVIEQLKALHDSLPSDPVEAELLTVAEGVVKSHEENPNVPVNLNPPHMDMLEMALQMSDGGEAANAMGSLLLGGKRTIIDTTTYGADDVVMGGPSKKPRLDGDVVGGTVCSAVVNDSNMRLKYSYGLNAWRQWVTAKNEELKAAGEGGAEVKQFKTEVLACSGEELSFYLSLFVREIRKPTGEVYAPDSIYYLCLGIQYYLYENGRIDNVFHDSCYTRFIDALNEILTGFSLKVNVQGQIVCRVTEEQLWEARQLGAHSPHVLLQTLIYFNTKHFLLSSTEAHLGLSFSNIMKQWKKSSTSSDGRSARTVYLRYNNLSQPNKIDSLSSTYEQLENSDNPLRCPVKLYEFYLAKCPETIKHRNDMFYLVPEPSCLPESPVWYSACALSGEAVTRVINRISVVREIQETLVLPQHTNYYG